MPNVPVTSFPQDVTTLLYSTTLRTMLTVGVGGGTLAIVDAAQNGAAVLEEDISGGVASGLFTLAPDGSGGTTLGFAPDPSLTFAVGHVILAGMAGQPASTYQDADGPGQILGLGGASTIGGALVVGARSPARAR